jgi:hypothetical protein
MDAKEAEQESFKWINLTQNMDQWDAVVMKVQNVWVL